MYKIIQFTGYDFKRSCAFFMRHYYIVLTQELPALKCTQA